MYPFKSSWERQSLKKKLTQEHLGMERVLTALNQKTNISGAMRVIKCPHCDHENMIIFDSKIAFCLKCLNAFSDIFAAAKYFLRTDSDSEAESFIYSLYEPTDSQIEAFALLNSS